MFSCFVLLLSANYKAIILRHMFIFRNLRIYFIHIYIWLTVKNLHCKFCRLFGVFRSAIFKQNSNFFMVHTTKSGSHFGFFSLLGGYCSASRISQNSLLVANQSYCSIVTCYIIRGNIRLVASQSDCQKAYIQCL